MSVGQTLYRRARIGWVEGTKTYSLRWDNVENNGDGLLSFHCDDRGPLPAGWTMTPVGRDGGAVLHFLREETDRDVLRSYNMPFSATLTAQ